MGVMPFVVGSPVLNNEIKKVRCQHFTGKKAKLN
jgi:hypothetical protein